MSLPFTCGYQKPRPPCRFIHLGCAKYSPAPTRGSRPPPTIDRVPKEGRAAAAPKTRPHLLALARPLLERMAGHPDRCQARDRGPLAQAGLQALLGLEEPTQRWPAGSRTGGPQHDPPPETAEPELAGVPRQSPQEPGLHRLLHGAHRQVPHSVRVPRALPRPAPYRSLQRHRASIGCMDRPTTRSTVTRLAAPTPPRSSASSLATRSSSRSTASRGAGVH